MSIKRAPVCTKHKPRVYKHQCKKCQEEFMERQLDLPGVTTKKTMGSDDNGQAEEE